MNDLINQVKSLNVKRIMLQLPDGLKIKAVDMVRDMKVCGVEAIIANNSCYGACDLADKEAKQMGCDVLVHVGHNKFYINFPTNVPVVYYAWPIETDISNIDFSFIKEKNIGLLTTIQHMNMLGKTKDMLENAGKTAIIGGQMLGCWTANADKITDKVDAFLYIGSGRFHPMAVRGKKIYALDLERNIIDEIDVVMEEKRRYANIFAARNAKTFGILVTTKQGQNQLLGNVEDIKKRLEDNEKEAVILIMNDINDAALQGIKVDAFINTACPRIIEDHFSKPIINAGDLDKIL